MKARDIEEYVTGKPFRPFRLVLDTGEQVTVRRPRKALLSGETVAVVGVSGGSEKLRIVRIDRIVSAEHVGADEC